MALIEDIGVRYFLVPLVEVMADAKHGARTHFKLVTAILTATGGLPGTGYTHTGGKGGPVRSGLPPGAGFSGNACSGLNRSGSTPCPG